jgi:serine/threonine-protein kinase
MKHDAMPLTSLVASVADGWPQDWAALEASAGDARTREGVRGLRAIAAIAAFHRGPAATTAQRSLDPGPPDPAADDTTPGREQPGAGAIPATGRWGRFRLLKLLGQGAYGEVYRALDTTLDREVALKLLKPYRSSAERTCRLLDEARMLAQVRHPNVASVYGVGEHEGRPGFWMELIDGVTLEELVQLRGSLSASEATLVGQDLCRALAAVHRAGLVHGDVKTANVMRELGGRIVLMDFGAGGCRGQGSNGTVMGTPLYTAPEVRCGRPATALSDIYSLGVVLFRLVTTAYPRKVVARFGDLAEPHEAGPLLSLRDLRPELPDSFVAVVERALARDPCERPQTAGSLQAALGVVLGVPLT